MAPYSKAVPDNVRAAADKIIAGTKDGTYEVFTGPIADQTGKERVAKGQRMDGQGPSRDGLVRQGRAELDANSLSPFTGEGGRASNADDAIPLSPSHGERVRVRGRAMRGLRLHEARRARELR